MLEHRRLAALFGAGAILVLGACSAAEQTEAHAEEAEMAAAPAASSASAQELTCFLRATPEEAAERPSPLGELMITFGDQAAKLCYGRPSVKGRDIMGGLVPFDTPWRMGANEATALHLPFEAEVGGVALAPGSYSLYAVPGESEWQMVINGQVERWGIPINEGVTAQDVGSFSRPSSSIDDLVETLTYTWESHGEGMGHIVMEWEHTRVEIPVHGPGM